jgi:hypothetical protein
MPHNGGILYKKKLVYIISKAFTKKVATKGMISVNQGQCVAIAMINAAVETKNNNQYNPLDFLFASMNKNFAQK